MMLDEFLQQLRATPRTWRLTKTGLIRQNGYCPITSLTKESAGHWLYAGNRLGLEDTFTIARAADNREGCNLDVRAELLAACGLTESAVSA
jgi:hypothetical protein